jgi:hypothetical protein
MQSISESVPNTTLSEPPIFIVGPGRSGTTLVRKILSAHSRITILPETQFIEWADQRENIKRAPTDFDAFWNKYTSWIRFRYLEIDPDRCLELINQQEHRTIRDIFTSVLIAYGEKTGKKRVGEKSPSHVQYLHILLEWFPDARIIIMQRDPRAVIASSLGTPWVKKRITPASLRNGVFSSSRLYELLYKAKNWNNIFETIIPGWESDSRIHIVAYEDLVRNPKKEVSKICRFIGETYEDGMLMKRESDISDVTGEDPMAEQVKQWKQHHSKTHRPISTSSLGKWKKKLSGLEVAMVEAICIKGMRRRAYNPSLSTGKRIAGFFLTRAHIAAEKIERITRHTFRKIRRFIS